MITAKEALELYNSSERVKEHKKAIEEKIIENAKSGNISCDVEYLENVDYSYLTSLGYKVEFKELSIGECRVFRKMTIYFNNDSRI